MSEKRKRSGTQQASKRRKPTPRSRVPTKAALVRALGVERKYFDVAIGFNVLATTDWAGGEVGADMPQIPQGDDQGQREGRKVDLTRVAFRGSLVSTPQGSAAAVAGASPVRIVLVRNMQSNAVSMNAEDVMGLNGGAAASSIVAVHMFQSTVSFDRAKIVDDIMCYQEATAAVNNASATTVSSSFKELPIALSYRPKKPIRVQWASGTTAVPTHNSFNILANCENTASTPSIQGICRFYYTDV